MQDLNLLLGIFDNPEEQTQRDYAVDLYRNNLAVFGSSMSGKTSLLKTLLFRIHQVCGITDKEEIYILDFGSNLGNFGKLPYVAACFDATHEENVRRMFSIIESRMRENVRKLDGKSFLVQKAEERPNHVVFILDGLNAFLSEERYTAYHEALQRIARDGLSKGISVVFAANEHGGGVHRLMGSFKRIIALDMPKEQYADIFGHRVEKPMSIKGRGMANTEKGIYEFQAYFPYNRDKTVQTEKKDEPEGSEKTEERHWTETDEINAIVHEMEIRCRKPSEGGILDEKVAESNAHKIANCAKRRIKNLSGDLTKDSWENYFPKEPTDEINTDEQKTAYEKYLDKACKATEFVPGLDFYSLQPVKIDLPSTRAIAIYGKKSSGKTNLLSLILEAVFRMLSAAKDDVKIVILEDAREGVRSPEKAPSVAAVLKRNACTPEYIESPQAFMDFLSSKYYYRCFQRDSSNSYSLLSYEEPKTDWADTSSSDDYWKDAQKSNQPPTDNWKERPHPYTVFVIQSRLFYQVMPGGPDKQMVALLDQFVSNESTLNPKLFVFSDVQRFTESADAAIFNNWIDHAFLLDDVVRFIGNPRGQKSVFGSQDPEELKEMFGKCEPGDGYYLNTGITELSKVKFIRQKETM